MKEKKKLLRKFLWKSFKIVFQIVCGLILAVLIFALIQFVSFMNSEDYYPPNEFTGTVIHKFPYSGITFYKSELESFSWAPDSQRLAGVLRPHGREGVVWATSDLIEPSEIYIWDIEMNHYKIISV